MGEHWGFSSTYTYLLAVERILASMYRDDAVALASMYRDDAVARTV